MSNEICYFTSADTGAPSLTNAVGSLIDVLDACLINGFNLRAVTSIVVSSDIATVTASAHGFSSGTGKCIDIMGAVPTDLNGRKKITSTGANTFTFPISGIADQTATGTITAKRSPLGWSKAFSATGKAIYARTDVTATTMLWRVDDTGSGVASATNARSIMVESATGIDTYNAPSPTAAQLAGGQYITKGTNNSTAKPWAVVGDSRTVYLFTDDASYSSSGLHTSAFGDIQSDKAGDVYGAFITGMNSSASATSFHLGSLDVSTCLARGATGIGGAKFSSQMSRLGANQLIGGSGPAYPSNIDNGMRIDRNALIREQNSTFGDPVRGVLRGLAHPLANLRVPESGLHLQVLSAIEGFAGEMLVVNVAGQGQPGAFLFDITGPWA